MALGQHTLAPGHAPEAIELIDRVFLRSRGRSGTVTERFPHVFGERAESTLFLTTNGSQPIGCIVLRLFDWRVEARTVCAAMVGFVCTAEEHRGKGVSTALLERVGAHIESSGIELGVLWTNIHGFYERCGWRVEDQSQFGRYVCAPAAGDMPPGISCASASNVNTFNLEAIRAHWCTATVLRSLDAYRVSPPVVDDVLCLHTGLNGPVENAGFALVGVSNETAYLYDIVGAPDTHVSLWSGMTALRPTLTVNTHPSQPFFTSLTKIADLRWSRQTQAMWLAPNPSLGGTGTSRYIPYFDRI